MRPAIAQLGRRSGASARQLARRAATRLATMPPHRQAMVVSAFFLLLLAGTVLAAVIAIDRVERDDDQLVEQTVPALEGLLNVDRDLHQAQLSMTIAATSGDPAERMRFIRFAEENHAQAVERFEAYRAHAVGIPGEDAVAAEHLRLRAVWSRTLGEVEQAVLAGQVPVDPQQLRALQSQFEAMRGQIDVLEEEYYEPVLTASLTALHREARSVERALMAVLAIGLAAGVLVARLIVQQLRRQQQSIDARNRERDEVTRRQALESRLGRALGMAADEDDALGVMTAALGAETPGVGADVMLADSSQAHLQLACTTRADGGGPQCGVESPFECPAVRAGQTLTFPDSRAYDACPHFRAAGHHAAGHHAASATCVPLSLMGKAVGVMHIVADAGDPIDEQTRQVLERVAFRGTERLGMIRAFRQTEAQATLDPLTGLINRRSLESQIASLTEAGQGFAVAYGDLDHFKRLNDTHGHETGDQALRRFAQLLKGCCRDRDLVCRWGGEEFVVVLPGTDAQGAVVVLDRVREALRPANANGATPSFTASFGVAALAPGSDFTATLRRADAALLRAKDQGRDRVVIAGADTEPADGSGDRRLAA